MYEFWYLRIVLTSSPTSPGSSTFWFSPLEFDLAQHQTLMTPAELIDLPDQIAVPVPDGGAC